MSEDRALDRLAARAGIEGDFLDETGQLRVVSDETKIALLTAMGLAADSEAAAASSLDRLEREAWRAVLPPVLVWPQGDAPPEVAVVLPAQDGAAELCWILETEDGRSMEGSALVDGLPVVETGSVDGRDLLRRALRLDGARPPQGYHRLRLRLGAVEHAMPLIAVPGQCHIPAGFEAGGKAWGIALQLYALRSEDDWGMGDFGHLGRFASAAAEQGADALGLNPLHALFPHNPLHSSPYSPSSRLWRNVFYIDVPAVPGFDDCAPAQALVASPRFQERLLADRGQELVDYAGLAARKLEVLEHLFAWFCDRHLGPGPEAARSSLGEEYRRFQAAGGDSLERHALFDALAERFGNTGWRNWPRAYRDPQSEQVAEFRNARRDRVDYFQYLQWLADRQLGGIAAKARTDGMRIGLYQDLALAADGGGADAWAQQGMYLGGVSIGAPPDAWNARGQNWGMPPLDPLALRADAYRHFSEVLDANMRHGGALRLDHAMALQRLYWIPHGADAAAGAYVRQPFEDLLGLVALHSQRNRCMVIGEDLGTVPEGFRERMHEARILSYRLLYFQRSADGEMTAPQDYPELSAVMVGTHDLAPLAGFWSGHDLDIRAALDLFPTPAFEQGARQEREEARRLLLAALRRHGLLPEDDPDSSESEALSPELVQAIHVFLARSAGYLMMVQLEDVLDVLEQPNLPGTVEEHPNWCRRLPLTIERIARDPRLLQVAETLRAARPRNAGAAGATPEP